MGRRAGRRELEDLLDRAREIVPGLSLRTTFLVGFPGEGGAEFAELMEFVEEQAFDHLGVFAYSPEPGTPAFGEDDRVSRRTARARRDRLMTRQQAISLARRQAEIGKIRRVLLDGPFPEENSALMVGHTRGQAPEIDGLVVVEGEDLAPGEMVKVEITAASEYDLYGRALGRE
jgi:ribosomal protein S12 methylthiotransferase